MLAGFDRYGSLDSLEVSTDISLFKILLIIYLTRFLMLKSDTVDQKFLSIKRYYEIVTK